MGTLRRLPFRKPKEERSKAYVLRLAQLRAIREVPGFYTDQPLLATLRPVFDYLVARARNEAPSLEVFLEDELRGFNPTPS